MPDRPECVCVSDGCHYADAEEVAEKLDGFFDTAVAAKDLEEVR